ncbi:MAG: hypothetical protein ACLFR0_01120 [Alphaproteobacteria bacterium]
MQKNIQIFVSITLFIFLGSNFLVWYSVRDVQARWLNVPPPPGGNSIAGAGLGDAQFAYRNIGLMLQNLGDTGGRATPLSDYNYEHLARWFFMADRLDARSDFAPFLAAYYFGAVEESSKIPPLVEYLAMVGQREEGEKWRWLAQAIHLARYRMQDLPLALDLAKKLASMNVPDLPVWAKTMDVMIMNVQGEKQAAYEILLQTLQTESDNLHPTETLFMIDAICSELLDDAQAKDHPLCQDLPF